MKTKKLLSIFLSILMIFSLMSVAVSAAAIEIEPYTPVSVTVLSKSSVVFRFVPEETKTYIVTSFATGDIDPYCEIESVNDSIYIDDSAGSCNFAEKIEKEMQAQDEKSM